MFINLRCSKPNGDFYITSSQVIEEQHPDWSPLTVTLHLWELATEHYTQGWDVEVTQQ